MRSCSLLIILCSLLSSLICEAKTYSLKELEILTLKIAPHRKKEAKKIAQAVLNESKKYQHDPKLMLAILKVESDFNQRAISKSKDYSIAQVNYKVWQKEFKLLNLPAIQMARLKSDMNYSIQIMGKILDIIKKRHINDPYWFARYHSSTPKFKSLYISKLKKQYMKLNQKNKEKRLYVKNN